MTKPKFAKGEPQQPPHTCILCTGTIVGPHLYAGFSGPFGDEIDWHEYYHPLCVALDTPTADIPGLAAHLPERQRELLVTISRRLNPIDKVRLVWRNPAAVRCIVQLDATTYALYHDGTLPPLAIEGPLRECVASVPDDDFESATAAMAVAEARPSPLLKRTRHRRQSIWIDEGMKGF